MDADRIEFAQVHAAPGPAPDWSVVTEDLHCPLCEYNLRGLTEPRCPECGHRFNWAALQDAKLRIHPWLFEHHPESNATSWIKTFWMARFPRRFWREVLSTHDVRIGRLLLYGAISFVISVLPLAIAFTSLGAAERALDPPLGAWTFYYNAPPPAVLPSRSSMLMSWCQHLLDAPTRTAPFIAGVILSLVWPWLTLATLMIFRISMRTRGIKTAHVIRCIVYSADAALWINLLAMLATIPLVTALLYFQPDYWDVAATSAWLGCVIWAAFSYRLYIAYRNYLGFHMPFATILATQVVVPLAVLAFLSLGIIRV